MLTAVLASTAVSRRFTTSIYERMLQYSRMPYLPDLAGDDYGDV